MKDKTPPPRQTVNKYEITLDGVKKLVTQEEFNAHLAELKAKGMTQTASPEEPPQ